MVIPALIWVNSLSVQLAVIEEKANGYDEAEEEVRKLKIQVEVLNTTLKGVKEDLERSTKNLDEIRSLLMHPPVPQFYPIPPQPVYPLPHPMSTPNPTP